MNLPSLDDAPTEHQRRCIERLLQTKDESNIIESLLAWKIHFRFQDELQHVHDTNSNNNNNRNSAAGPDVLGPLRLYNTFNNDDLNCLASLAEVELPAVSRWIDKSGE
jgi:hypothetical protein